MIEDLQRHFDKLMYEQNNRGLPEFEGYSPFEMHNILHFTFEPSCPVQLQTMIDPDYEAIPMLNQIKYLADLIKKNGDIQLTRKGFLPTKIVTEIYNKGFLKEELIESGISKLYKETDSMTINLTRILSEISGLTKKRNGKLSLTKNGERILSCNSDLLKLILLKFCTKFNWAYYDGYGENNIGQLGFGFSIILVNKYGQEKCLDKFYADKYFKAFPQLIAELTTSPDDKIESFTSRCYSTRTFDRFLDYFGLIKIESEKKWHSDKYISKTKLFDKLIRVRPHNQLDDPSLN